MRRLQPGPATVTESPLSAALQEAAATVRAAWPRTPRIGCILGSGLGGLARALDSEAVLPYETIPHFARSTALGHAGRLACGLLEGAPALMFEGRFHRYEGYTLQQVTFPVRLLAALGADMLLVSNAAGGLDPASAPGDVMVIEDQINLQLDNPLVGVNDDALGPRFPDMSAPYDPLLSTTALEVARRHGIRAWEGVYAAVTGPSYETRAEYRMLRTLGADAVGMSTVPEVIVAVQAGLRVLGLSVITNLGLPDAPRRNDADEVVAAGEAAGRCLEILARGVVREVVR